LKIKDKIKDILEVIDHNEFLSVVFCWTIISFLITFLIAILEACQ